MRRIAVRLLLLLVVAAAMIAVPRPASAASADDLLRDADKARQQLMQDKKAQGLRHNWLNVIERYQRVLDSTRTAKLSAQALLAVADLYVGLYKQSRIQTDLDEGLERYRQVAKRFPGEPAAAQAQLRIGRIYLEHKDDPDRAYVELLKVELNYPKSREVPEARKYMAQISGDREAAKTASAPAAPAAAPEPAPSKTAPAPKPVPPPAAQATIQGVRHWANPNYSRLAIDLDREVAFQDHLLRPDPDLSKPMRLYLDLKNTRIGPDVVEDMPIADGLLKRARVARFDQETIRVVLDIQNIYNYRIFSLNDPFRIVVDVTGHPAPDAAAKPNAQVQASPQAGQPAPKEPQPLTDLSATAQKRKKLPRGPAHVDDAQSSLARQLGLGIRRVVLDPGHGGKDRGATGITGLIEKDLSLKITLKLAEKIRTRLGLDVVLTRKTDVFVPLEERTAIANTKGADLFISIHANAHRDPKICGLETYFLNLATDEEAMRVAALENAATHKTMSDLQVILNDLMLNSKISESGRLAGKVHRAMVGQVKRYRGLKDLGVKQAPFYVLIGANMPSVLVELGFISNKVEESRLKTDKYIDRLTDGLVEGVKAYAASVKLAN